MSTTLFTANNTFMNGTSKGVLVASESVHTSHMSDAKNLFNTNVHYANNINVSTQAAANLPNGKALSLPPTEPNTVHTTYSRATAKP